MMNEQLLQLMHEYESVLGMQKFVEKDLDYKAFSKHLPFLLQLDAVETGGIMVFDNYKREHIFVSDSLGKLMGYEMHEIHEKGNDYFDERFHPDDMVIILNAAIQYLRYFFSIEPAERPSIKFKAINEYRIRNGQGQYVRVIEQFMPLEYDKYGNMWLVVSVLDLKPGYSIDHPASSRLFLSQSGETKEFQPKTESSASLSKREQQILRYIAQGKPSKSIADELFISVNTVNTHRQKIIEKLDVSNTFEAIQYAHKIGLFSYLAAMMI